MLMGYTMLSQAQVLDANTAIALKISNGNSVTVYKSRSSFDTTSNEYYYLPTPLRISRNKNEELEFSFIEYKEKGQVSGAILHVLITWGLTKNQLEEIQERLVEIKGKEVRLMGAVLPKAINPNSGFIISGTSNLVELLNKSITSIGKTPVFANTKIAASFQFNASGAIIIKEALATNNTALKNTFFAIPYQLKYNTYNNHTKTIKLKTNLYELLNTKL